MSDYLKEAEQFEEESSYDSYDVLEESTLKNIGNIKNIEQRGKEMGEFLCGIFTERQIDDLCDAIKEGFSYSNKEMEAERKEEEKLNEMFYNGIDEKD